MKDIPMFTTEYGVASLMLSEIPYRQEAYIRVQDAQPGQMEALIRECVSFCRMAGAERIYWSAGEVQGTAHVDKQKLESVFPVTEQTVSRWREIYNQRMLQVDNAATLTALDEKKILQTGGAYFVHHEGNLLGIFWLEDTKLLGIAAVERGAGERVLYAAMSLIEGATMTLEVASTNEKAIALYERLGFLKTKELRRWYEGV